jgi:hypothetical protein
MRKDRFPTCHWPNSSRRRRRRGRVIGHRRLRPLPRLATTPDWLCRTASMSAIGPKRTWACAPHMSVFGGKADIDCTIIGSPSIGLVNLTGDHTHAMTKSATTSRGCRVSLRISANPLQPSAASLAKFTRKNLGGRAITGACRRVSRAVYWITFALPGQRTLAHRRQLN